MSCKYNHQDENTYLKNATNPPLSGGFQAQPQYQQAPAVKIPYIFGGWGGYGYGSDASWWGRRTWGQLHN